ncbi:DUF637 domain-containing protein, partial [Trinickia diaoshuihuensis]|uniref:DUF637 domain-containing protein n=1 Tax=Trinickia diaoshuihuensis TaxID=2292265 RepID=UPI0013C33AFD
NRKDARFYPLLLAPICRKYPAPLCRKVTLTNRANQVDVGEIWANAGGDMDSGYEETTGTLVQSGGFMTAAAGQMSLNVSQLNQIGGLLQEVSPDGSVNNAATQQLLGQVLQQLGGNFTQTTVSDNLHTHFVAAGGFGVTQIVAMVAAIAASIVTAGAAAAAMGATLASMTLGESIVVGMASAMAGSLTSQIVTGNGIDFGAVLEAGAVGALTAGLTNGITYNSTTGSFGLGNLDQGLNSLPQDTSTLGQLAGISNIGGSLVPQAGQAATGSLPQEIAALGATATISAGVQTAIEGGSFLDNLKQAAVSDAAAVGAFAIGNANDNNVFGSGISGELGYVAAHGLLGCAAGAAEGTGCAGGAIGGAASAALSPDVLKAIDPTGAALSPGQQAAMEGFATLLGGGLAGLAGANAQGGANAALNEVLNNTDDHPATAAKNGGVLGTLAGAFSDMLNVVSWTNSVRNSVQGQLLSLFNANRGRTGPSDANNQIPGGGDDNNTSGPAGAVVIPSVPIPTPYGAVVMTPPLIAPGTPILSSGGNGEETGSSQSSTTGNAPATSSTYDTSITSPGSKYPNVRTDVTASQFQANLIANGYSVQNQGTSTNGAFTVLSDGTSTYTIYTRTSTGAAGVQYVGPNGSVKFSLGGH